MFIRKKKLHELESYNANVNASDYHLPERYFNFELLYHTSMTMIDKRYLADNENDQFFSNVVRGIVYKIKNGKNINQFKIYNRYDSTNLQKDLGVDLKMDLKKIKKFIKSKTKTKERTKSTTKPTETVTVTIKTQNDIDDLVEEKVVPKKDLRPIHNNISLEPTEEVVEDNSTYAADYSEKYNNNDFKMPDYLIGNVLYENLNNRQLEAVCTTEGYVRVIAGAGSGKTRCLTTRYMHLVTEYDISTANILCVTFTNKAANEMKSRVRKMIGDYDLAYICTFHGFGVKFLREECSWINYPENFLIMDETDKEDAIRRIIEDLNIKLDGRTVKHFSNQIRIFKADKYVDYPKYFAENSSQELYQKSMDFSLIEEDRIFFRYLYEQKKSFLFDFEDQIHVTLYILNMFQEPREKWQERMQYIMVDEYQDVNGSNNELVEILSDKHHNLFVVGDPDQTIYSWRGADIKFIVDFDKEHPDCHTVILEENYRSNENILLTSNQLISKNQGRIKKNLFGNRSKLDCVYYYHAEDLNKQAAFLVNTINDNINTRVYNYNDFAVLYRANRSSQSIEESFLRNKVPYKIYGNISFYERKEIKDVLSYLKLIIYQDDISFRRIINVPKRGFGRTRIKRIQEYADANYMSLYDALKANMGDPFYSKTGVGLLIELVEKYKGSYKTTKITDILEEVLDRTKYEQYLKELGEDSDDRLQNLLELKDSIFRYETTAGEETDIAQYLQDIALLTSQDTDNDDREKVTLTSIHQAKGLEFPIVFVIDMNEGIFPSSRDRTIQELEEDRRVCYVAMTRAKDKLYLTDSEGYYIGSNGNSNERFISRFIFDIGKENITYIEKLPINLVLNSKRFIENKEYYQREYEKRLKNEQIKFVVGDRVRHRGFGEGIIESIDEITHSYIIKFDNFSSSRNLAFSANLEKIDDDKDDSSLLQF